MEHPEWARPPTFNVPVKGSCCGHRVLLRRCCGLWRRRGLCALKRCALRRHLCASWRPCCASTGDRLDRSCGSRWRSTAVRGRMWPMEVLDRGMFQASLAEYGGSVLVWRGTVRSRVGRRCQQYRADDSPEAVWACGTSIGLLTLGPSTVKRQSRGRRDLPDLRRLLTDEGYGAGFNARPDPARSLSSRRRFCDGPRIVDGRRLGGDHARGRIGSHGRRIRHRTGDGGDEGAAAGAQRPAERAAIAPRTACRH